MVEAQPLGNEHPFVASIQKIKTRPHAVNWAKKHIKELVGLSANDSGDVSAAWYEASGGKWPTLDEIFAMKEERGDTGSLGKELKMLREGLEDSPTPNQLAKVVRVSMSKIAASEEGHAKLSPEEIERYAKGLGIDAGRMSALEVKG